MLLGTQRRRRRRRRSLCCCHTAVIIITQGTNLFHIHCNRQKKWLGLFMKMVLLAQQFTFYFPSCESQRSLMATFALHRGPTFYDFISHVCIYVPCLSERTHNFTRNGPYLGVKLNKKSLWKQGGGLSAWTKNRCTLEWTKLDFSIFVHCSCKKHW